MNKFKDFIIEQFVEGGLLILAILLIVILIAILTK